MLSKSQSKYIQSLHHKKFRDEEGCFIAEGDKVVLELLQAEKFNCKQVLALPEWFHENEVRIRKTYKGEIIELSEMELEKISALATPNRVLAVFKMAEEKEINPKGRLSLVLDEMKDPGNLGTVIRIADWFGISSVVCSNNSVDVYNPKVVQGSMGSMARVDVVYADLIVWLQKNKSVKKYAAVLNGNPVHEMGKITEGILIVGNESNGIHRDILALADEKITIPKLGQAESLNAAVAAGIIISHLVLK